MNIEKGNPDRVIKLGKRGLLAVLLAIAGCAHHNDIEIEGRGFTRVFTPQIPSFMIGPASALLTNNSGFTARVVVEGEASLQESKPIEGQLFCRGSKMFFAPQGLEKLEQDSPAKGFSYVWDAATGKGQIRSEALQAYAPVATSLNPTNATSLPAGTTTGDVTVTMNDGSKIVFQVTWDARSGLPVGIKAAGSPPLSLSLSKIKLKAPPEEIFGAPEGFAKYPSAEVLADELAARQHNLRRGIPLLPTTTPGPADVIRQQ